MARSLACQWGNNSWQCAWGCTAMRFRWSSACHVAAKILKCLKSFSTVSRLVTTPLWSAHAWHSVLRISWTVRNLCVTDGTTWHATLRSIGGTKFVPVWGLLYTWIRRLKACLWSFTVFFCTHTGSVVFRCCLDSMSLSIYLFVMDVHEVMVRECGFQTSFSSRSVMLQRNSAIGGVSVCLSAVHYIDCCAYVHWRGAATTLKQEAQLSQRPRDASCHWIFRLLTQGHWRSLEMTPLSTACISLY